jgi:hypothetical protein
LLSCSSGVGSFAMAGAGGAIGVLEAEAEIVQEPYGQGGSIKISFDLRDIFASSAQILGDAQAAQTVKLAITKRHTPKSTRGSEHSWTIVL